jgi:hypothetical protein
MGFQPMFEAVGEVFITKIAKDTKQIPELGFFVSFVTSWLGRI